MLKHELVAVVSYDEAMTFEEVHYVENNFLSCMEENLAPAQAHSFVNESSENSFILRCELPAILPLHFLQTLAQAISHKVTDGAECKILLFSSSLSTVTVALCRDGEYTIHSGDATKSLQHREPFTYTQKGIAQSSIIFLTLVTLLL